MLKHMGNDRGVALLIVMVIMSVLVVVGSLMLTMSSSESRMVYDYGNNNRAFYIAEAGVDLAIKEWADYVGSLPRDSENPDYPELLLEKADIPQFKTSLEAAGDNLVKKFRNNNNYNNQEVYINYTEYQPDSVELDYSSDTVKNILLIKVEGKYEKAVYEYEVKLWYYSDGRTEADKGSGEPKEPPLPTDTTAPTVNANPEGGLYNTQLSVTLTASEPATIYFTTDGSEPTESSSKYTGPIIISHDTMLKFMAVDLAGNWSEIYTENYLIDTDPLTVISTDPSGGATGVPVDKTITVTFSETVQQGANFNSISLKDNNGNPIAADISTNDNDRVLYIKPNGNLAYSTEFTVIIPAGAVKDMAGNPLSSNNSFSFTTVQPVVAGPGEYALYTNSAIFKNNAMVIGNVLVGNGIDVVEIGNNSTFYGNVYVNTDLTVNNNSCIGNSTQTVQFSVKGSVTLDNNVCIYGNLFYEENLTMKNNSYVSGQKQKTTVNNPQVNLPALNEQLYIGESYTIIANDAWSGNLQDNGKYFFKTSLDFNNNYAAENIIIACTGDIEFKNNFNGSGVIFAPNGTVSFKNNCDFTGVIISKAVYFKNNANLTYKSYTTLPY